MKKNSYFALYFCFLALQILICNYLNLGYLLTLYILPVLVLLIPIKYSTISTLLIAFVSGLLVDMLGDGVIGLNAFAIVPVALARKGLLRFIFGQEVFSHKEDVTIRKYGFLKFSTFIAMGQALFLFLYIAADGAGTRSFWFNAGRFGISLVAGTLLSLLIANALTKDYRER